MARHVYSKVKKPYFKLAESREYTAVEIITTLLKKEEDPWFIFSKKIAENKYSKRITNLNYIKLEELLKYIKNYDEKVALIKHLISIKEFNPLADYVPLNKLGDKWKQLVINIKNEIKEYKLYFKSIKTDSMKVLSKDKRLGMYFKVVNKQLRESPFEIYPYLDFYIAYDIDKKSCIIKTNPLHKKRMDLQPIFQLLLHNYEVKFYRHKGNFFILSKEVVSEYIVNYIVNQI